MPFALILDGGGDDGCSVDGSSSAIVSSFLGRSGFTCEEEEVRLSIAGSCPSSPAMKK